MGVKGRDKETRVELIRHKRNLGCVRDFFVIRLNPKVRPPLLVKDEILSRPLSTEGVSLIPWDIKDWSSWKGLQRIKNKGFRIWVVSLIIPELSFPLRTLSEFLSSHGKGVWPFISQSSDSVWSYPSDMGQGTFTRLLHGQSPSQHRILTQGPGTLYSRWDILDPKVCSQRPPCSFP